MNTEFFDEYEEFFDFSSEFNELEKEDKITRSLPQDKNVNYEVVRIEKEGGDKENDNEGEWEDDITHNEKKEGDNEKPQKKVRLYK